MRASNNLQNFNPFDHANETKDLEKKPAEFKEEPKLNSKIEISFANQAFRQLIRILQCNESSAVYDIYDTNILDHFEVFATQKFFH